MYTTIQLDKVRNFRYGMAAIDQIEGELGTNIARLDLENLTMKQTAVVLWAGLAHEDPDLTPAKVMGLVDDYSDLNTVLGTMSKAFTAAFNGKGKKAKKRLEGGEVSDYNIYEALELAAQIEMSVLEFWKLTPFEFSLCVDSYCKRKKFEQDERITAAYMGAYFERVKKMPNLQELLDKEQQEVKKKEQTPTDMLAEVKRINAALGGTEF